MPDPDVSDSKVCPYCAETIKAAAVICRFCNRELAAAPPTPDYNDKLGSFRAKQRVAVNAGEKTYYESSSVTVTSTRLIVYGKIYALSNIASVNRFEVSPNYSPVVFVALLGIGLLAFEQQTLGGILLAAAIVIGFLLKPRYAVRLGASSGETDAYVTPDKARAQEIVSAVEKAIMERG